MHHPVAIVTQIAQESGQHGGRLRLRVVQQDDALARRLEAVGQQFQLRFLRHRDPVVGNDIGAEYDDAAATIKLALAEKDPEVAVKAAEVLSGVGSDADIPALKKALEKTDNEDVRTAVTDAIETLEP